MRVKLSEHISVKVTVTVQDINISECIVLGSAGNMTMCLCVYSLREKRSLMPGRLSHVLETTAQRSHSLAAARSSETWQNGIF